MGRGNFSPKEFGVDMGRTDFTDLMCDDFNDTYNGAWTIDELPVHPREAALFCDQVRHKHGYCDLPDDDVNLRVIMTRRKNP